MKAINDGYPAFQVHEEAGDGHVDDELVARGSQRSVSGNIKNKPVKTFCCCKVILGIVKAFYCYHFGTFGHIK